MTLPFSGSNIFIRFIVLGVIALYFGRGLAVVSAETIHQIKMSQAPKVIVWHGMGGPITGDLVEVSANFVATAVAPTYVQTGILDPIETGFDGAADKTQKTFRVASNAAFSIRAQAKVVDPAADAPFRLTLSAIGPNAQLPGARDTQSGLMLSDLRTPQVIYQGSRRTAARRGSVASQSVEFTANWQAGPQADVTFTVFVP